MNADWRGHVPEATARVKCFPEAFTLSSRAIKNDLSDRKASNPFNRTVRTGNTSSRLSPNSMFYSSVYLPETGRQRGGGAYLVARKQV